MSHWMTSGASRLKAKLSKTKEQSHYQPSFVTFSSSGSNRLRRRGCTTGAVATNYTKPLIEEMTDINSDQLNPFERKINKNIGTYQSNSYQNKFREISSINIPTSNKPLESFKAETYEHDNHSSMYENFIRDLGIKYAKKHLNFSSNEGFGQFQQFIIPHTRKTEQELLHINHSIGTTKRKTSSVMTQLGVFGHVYTTTQVLDNYPTNGANSESSTKPQSYQNDSIFKFYNDNDSALPEVPTCGISKFKNIKSKTTLKASQFAESNRYKENISAENRHHPKISSHNEGSPNSSNSHQILRYFNNGIEVEFNGKPLNSFLGNTNSCQSTLAVVPISELKDEEHVQPKQNVCQSYSKMTVSTEIRSKIIQNNSNMSNHYQANKGYCLPNSMLKMDEIENTIQSLSAGEDTKNDDDVKLKKAEFSDLMNNELSNIVDSNANIQMKISGEKNNTRNRKAQDTKCRVVKKCEMKPKYHARIENKKREKRSSIVDTSAKTNHKKRSKSSQKNDKSTRLNSSKQNKGPHTALIDEIFG